MLNPDLIINPFKYEALVSFLSFEIGLVCWIGFENCCVIFGAFSLFSTFIDGFNLDEFEAIGLVALFTTGYSLSRIEKNSSTEDII